MNTGKITATHKHMDNNLIFHFYIHASAHDIYILDSNWASVISDFFMGNIRKRFASEIVIYIRKAEVIYFL